MSLRAAVGDVAISGMEVRLLRFTRNDTDEVGFLNMDSLIEELKKVLTFLMMALRCKEKRRKIKMCVKDASECEKGDISRQGLGYEILVERSLPNSERITYSMWKRVRGMEKEFKCEFSVWHCYKEGENTKFEKPDLAWTTNEAEARRVYEDSCDGNGCSPYPEADKYYERSKVGRERIKKILGL